MKKITLLFAALVTGVTMQAQEFSAVSDSEVTGETSNAQAVVWDQPSVGGNGIVSGFSIQEDLGVYSADDFELTESTVITAITVYGFNGDGTFPTNVSGLGLYIYENNGANVPSGDPTQAGSGVLELPSIETLPIPGYPIEIIEDGTNYTIVIDMYLANGDSDVVLPAGQYWLVIAPRLNIADITDGANRWNWFDAGVPANGVNEAHLIDPTDLFGAGATSWTAFSALGLAFGSVAFTIEGDPALSVGDNLAELSSVYPNPTNNVLNVKLPSNAEVKSSSLFDILGKDTGVRLINGQMDTSDLARGVYILNVNTTMGVLTQKVVKQ